MLSKEDFKGIYKAHFGAIRKYMLYRCGDMDMASDVAQDVFMEIWEKRSSLNVNHIIPLLYRIASVLLYKNYQMKLRQMSFEQRLTNMDDTAQSPEEELRYKELVAAYAKTLEQMPEKFRVVFLMNREEGMKYAEIAKCLQISVKTVEKYMSAALQLLKMKIL
jgi:RNA polymerase sigma-70 factor (ECF subfamily)